MTRIANRAFEMSSKSTGHAAIQVPDLPGFMRRAYPKSGGMDESFAIRVVNLFRPPRVCLPARPLIAASPPIRPTT